jgi:hypothetical protein
MMKTRNTTTKLIAMVIAVAIATTIWTIWGVSRVGAAKFDAKTTGIFGIARGQTARINVLNTEEDRGFSIHDKVLLYDSHGNTLAEFRGPINLPMGHATSFDFDANSIVTDGSRVQVRWEVEVTARPGRPNAGGDLIITGEVFDNDTGKTTYTQTFEECACG